MRWTSTMWFGPPPGSKQWCFLGTTLPWLTSGLLRVERSFSEGCQRSRRKISAWWGLSLQSSWIGLTRFLFLLCWLSLAECLVYANVDFCLLILVPKVCKMLESSAINFHCSYIDFHLKDLKANNTPTVDWDRWQILFLTFFFNVILRLCIQTLLDAENDLNFFVFLVEKLKMLDIAAFPNFKRRLLSDF